MWQDLITRVETYVNHEANHTVSSIGSMLPDLSQILNCYCIQEEGLPYGRYLVHIDRQKRFNIQLDIFSEHYAGQIHCHESWGLLAVIKGSLICEQWSETADRNFLKTSETLLTRGSSQTFCPPASDWHKVITASPGEQVLSMHIYGEGFNLDKGIYLDDSFLKHHATRSNFKPLECISPFIQVRGKPEPSSMYLPEKETTASPYQ